MPVIFIACKPFVCFVLFLLRLLSCFSFSFLSCTVFVSAFAFIWGLVCVWHSFVIIALKPIHLQHVHGVLTNCNHFIFNAFMEF